MVLRIRVRFGKQDTAGAGESVQPPATKRQRIDSRKDYGPPQIMKAAKKEKKKKMQKQKQKQPPIAAAGEIRKPMKLRILIKRPNYLPTHGGFTAEVKKPTAAVQQPAWALSPGQMTDSIDSTVYEGGGEPVSVNQAWRPTYFYSPEVNSYSGFPAGRRRRTEGRPCGSKYNPIVISGEDSDQDDAESVGENDPVDDWSNHGEGEYSSSCPSDFGRVRFQDEDDRMSSNC